jgi:putative ubiquitin-RnfH superfamily antitoxin RatB of RatAB toxin-antitoxin module
MAEAPLIQVNVLLAEADQQRSVSLELPAGSTAWQAVESSRLLQGRSDLDPAQLAVAVYGRQVPRERELEDGDRVEILRPLTEDPKARRRRAARAGRSLGKR